MLWIIDGGMLAATFAIGLVLLELFLFRKNKKSWAIGLGIFSICISIISVYAIIGYTDQYDKWCMMFFIASLVITSCTETFLILKRTPKEKKDKKSFFSNKKEKTPVKESPI